MKENPRILVAYDGSYQACQALREAIDVARRFKGSITVLIVYRDEAEAGGLRDGAETRMGETFVEHRVIAERSPSPPGRILWHAESGGYDLIVMGGRGAGRGGPWAAGSVSRRVLEESPCPVLVVN